MHNKINSRAIVLGYHPIREADLISILLTEQEGKVHALARGVRSSKRRFMGGLDLFDCGMFELTPARHSESLFLIQSFSDREVWLGLRNNLISFTVGSFCLELSSLFAAEGDPHGATLFSPLHGALQTLNRTTTPEAAFAIAIRFGLTSLKLGGYNPFAKSPDVSRDITEWWAKLVQEHEPALPENRLHIFDSAFFLIHYTEQVIGKELRCHGPLLSKLVEFRERFANG